MASLNLLPESFNFFDIRMGKGPDKTHDNRVKALGELNGFFSCCTVVRDLK